MDENYKALLTLTRLGIGNYVSELPKQFDWETVKAIADLQGLTAIIIDGVEKLPDNRRPSKPLLLQWIGELLQGYETRYELYCRAHAEIANFYNHHGFKMMVLKGIACSIDWPRPEHRPCGDIDIWLFGKQKEADALLTKERAIKIDYSHHHHTVFEWEGFTVENHYDILNVHQHHSNVKLERLIKELAMDNSHRFNLNGVNIYLPSPDLHALFLLRHSMIHFSSTDINLRQLLDWAFFVKTHGKEVNWEWLLPLLEEYGMIRMFNNFNAICVEDLGFDVSLFPMVQFEPWIKERVLNDILAPEFSENEPVGLIRRLFFIFRRWRANIWKHKLCFNDSLWSAFWTGIWGHIAKPH